MRKKTLPTWFAEEMVGDYSLALDREFEVFGEKFFRTVRGEFVHSSRSQVKRSVSEPHSVSDRPAQLKAFIRTFRWDNAARWNARCTRAQHR